MYDRHPAMLLETALQAILSFEERGAVLDANLPVLTTFTEQIDRLVGAIPGLAGEDRHKVRTGLYILAEDLVLAGYVHGRTGHPISVLSPSARESR